MAASLPQSGPSQLRLSPARDRRDRVTAIGTLALRSRFIPSGILAEWQRQSEEVLRRPGVSPRLVWVLPRKHQTPTDLDQQCGDGRGVELRHSCNTIAPWWQRSLSVFSSALRRQTTFKLSSADKNVDD